MVTTAKARFMLVPPRPRRIAAARPYAKPCENIWHSRGFRLVGLVLLSIRGNQMRRICSLRPGIFYGLFGGVLPSLGLPIGVPNKRVDDDAGLS